MIYSDTDIIEAIENGNISIVPFDRKNLGSNSYDQHLSNKLIIYESVKGYIDIKDKNSFTVREIIIPEELFTLAKNEFECNWSTNKVVIKRFFLHIK